jgi:GNAT superfamily N-acetyltransferase
MPDSEFKIRTMHSSDFDEVAALIRDSTNAWYTASNKPAIFHKQGLSTRIYCEIYEALDPGCCVVAEHSSGRLAGSCFYRTRETHMALGIMNVHPDFFRRGVASMLLRHITDLADAARLPLRLVSSAMNLDSFSLYTRAGFVPRMSFADMFIAVPRDGLNNPHPHPHPLLLERVRPARLEDIKAIGDLEMHLSHIRREKDYRFIIENAHKVWHMSVIDDGRGGIDGYLASINHPASNMLGPGIARTQQQAAALIAAELGHHPGRSPVFLIPVECSQLMQTIYWWGGRNVETHFAQVRGRFDGFNGVIMPTFMPETG